MRSEKSVRDVEEVLPNVYYLSKYLGSFPFTFSDNNIVVTPLSCIPVLIPLCFLILNLLSVQPYLDMMLLFEGMSFREILFLPLHVVCSIPIFSSLWIALRLKKFAKVLNSLGFVESITHNPISYQTKLPLCTLILLVLNLSCNVFFSENGPSLWPPIVLVMEIWFVTLVVLQFTTLIAVLTRHYEHLFDILSLDRAVDLLQCHEVLVYSFNLILECYTPQLLIIIVAAFADAVSEIYFLIQSHIFKKFTSYIISTVIWILFVISAVWHLAHSCSTCLEKAKKFDKALLQLMIFDESKSLLKNKRLVNHFKAKLKVEFTVMGFFSLDYSLLCSMISIATTYIVIMVQFT